MFAEFPHGVFPWGSFLSTSVTKYCFPNQVIDGVAADVLFKIPLFRHLFSWIGTKPASAKNIQKSYQDGHSVGITVGGISEIFLVGGEKERIYLKKHKGFVREAIKNGAYIVPVYCYGNSGLLKVIGEGDRTSMGLLKKLSRVLNASVVFFYGRFGLPIPFRHRVKFVAGVPMKIVKNPNPSKEEIAKIHDEFCEELTKLYYRHLPEWQKTELLII